MKTLLSAVIGATLALAAFEVGAQGTPGERQVALTIESTSLSTALDKWAQQSGFQIFVQDWEATKNLTAPSLKGTFTAQAALEQLLQGTPLTYVWLSEKAVSIRKKVPQTVPSALQRTGLEGAPSVPVAKFVGDDAGGSATQYSASETGGDSSAANPRVDQVEEIIVTGTHIKGQQPAGSKIIVLDREYLDKSGYARIEDVLATLPQTFGGNTEGNQAIAAQNLNRGSEIQLRGLGTGTTLVLVNGHRQAAGGLQGGFVDISSIPTSAIERIDVLPDGASAIYGSDAIGGVINVILRSDFQGAETFARFGAAQGGGEEQEISQLLGTNWSTGNLFFGYQYLRHDELPAAERDVWKASGDFRNRGGGDFRQPFGVPGTILDPLTFEPAYAIPSGQDGRQLTPEQLIPGSNHTDFGSRDNWILPSQELNAAFVSARQELGESLELSADARYGRREFQQLSTGNIRDFLFVPSSNPVYVNAFGGTDPVVVLYDFTKDLGPQNQTGTTDTFSGTVGLRAQLSDRWDVTLSGTYANETNRWKSENEFDFDRLNEALADSDPATAFNAFGDGGDNNPETLDLIRRTTTARGESTIKTFDLIFNGELLTLPSGSAQLALGASYRDDELATVSESDVGAEMSRHSTAAFAEFAIPLVGHDETRSGLTRLDLSIAGRYEEYSDFGSTFDPKYGISWWPSKSVRLRGTWSTSFRAPPFALLSEVLTPSASALLELPDPQSPSGSSNSLIVVGGNPDLKEETATIWTAGFDISLPLAEALTLSATYFDVDYRDKVSSPDSLSAVLANQDQYAALLTRNPSQAQIDAICSRPDFLSDPAACASLPIQLIIDGREKNIALTAQRGLDFQVDYALAWLQSTWRLVLNGTYIIHNDRAITEASPATDVVDTVGAPLALRMRGGLSWRRGGWSADAIVNYQGSYTDTVSPSARTVGAWTTTDLHLGYDFAERGDWLSDLRLGLHALNVLDDLPPFVNHFYGYDTANGTLTGRVLSAQVSKKW